LGRAINSQVFRESPSVGFIKVRLLFCINQIKANVFVPSSIRILVQLVCKFLARQFVTEVAVFDLLHNARQGI
jgi:hypothetical protein